MKKTIKFHTIAVMNGKEIDLEDAVNGVANENFKLNKRIDKAIEWVNKNRYYFPNPDKLLSILRGEDNE